MRCQEADRCFTQMQEEEKGFMKILLTAVNAKYIHSNLAVRLLKAYVQEAEPSVPAADIRIRELTINQSRDEILETIYEEQPEILLFSCYIWNIRMISELLKDIPGILPKTRVWLGGPEVSFDPEAVLQTFPKVQGIMLGEGEETFRELIMDHYLRKEKDLADIPGICFRSEDGSLIRTAPRPLLPMDRIPFVYTDTLLGSLEHRMVYYESSRGCPFGCSYCLSSVDKTVRFRSLDLVFRELQFFLDRNVRQVKFVDRTFNIDPKRSAEILRFLLEHDNGITNFHFEIAGDLLSEEEMDIMGQMRPGLVQLEIGVQSTCPETLQAIHRRCDLSRLSRNTERIRRGENIHQHLDLIAGLPMESYERFRQSFDEVYAMQPHQLQLGFLKVLKGSPMEQEAERYGIVRQQEAPYEVLYTNWITYPQLRRLKRIEEMVERYYNSLQFTKTLGVLEQCFPDAFSMYESLADYYERKGLFVNTPSRQYRYQALLDLAVEIDPGYSDLYRELLTCDLYLRENLKSRPDFAADLHPFRERIRQIRQEKGLSVGDKNVHVDVFSYPVWEADLSGIRDSGRSSRLVLFDYRHRNALSRNAGMEVY